MSPRTVTLEHSESMSRQQGLLLRGNRWHLNIKVPLDLQEAFGKTHIRESLGTSDHREASRRIVFERARLVALFDEQRRKISAASAAPPKSEKTILTVVSEREAFEWAIRCFVSCEHKFKTWMEKEGRFLEPYERDAIAETVSADADDLESMQEFRGELLDGTSELQRFLEGENIECATTSPAFEALRPLIREATIEHLRRKEDLLQGRKVQQRNPFFKEVHAYSRTPAEPEQKPTLTDLLKRRERAIGDMRLCEKTHDVFHTLASLLREFFGGGKLLSTISPDDIRRLFDLLKRVPPNASKRYKGMTLAQAAEAAEKAGDSQRLRPKTLKNHYTNINALFRFAVEERLMESNPAGTSTLRKSFGENVRSEPREQFTIQELNKLFRSSFHMGFLTENASQPGRFWVPLLALFHGFRCNEACQLYTEDVKTWEGITYIAIREEREDGSPSEKKLKTKQSKREVPLHPELVRLGFLKFVEAQKRNVDSPRLFPELTWGHNGYASDAFSKWFVRHVKKTVGIGCNATMHSFRHMFRDATRSARLPSETVALLAGWEHGEVSQSRQLRHYGRGPEYLRTLAVDIAKVEYPGLDLTHLTVTETTKPKPPVARLREG